MLIDKTRKILLIFAGICLILMMLQVTLDVALKLILQRPIPLTYEIVTYYYMAGIAFLPLMALETKKHKLIHVELLYERLPKSLKQLCLLFSMSFSIVYTLLAGLAALAGAWRATQLRLYTGTDIIIQVWPARYLPVFGLFGLVIALVIVIKQIRFGRPKIT